MQSVEGNLVDLELEEIYPAIVFFQDGKIVKIERTQNKYDVFLTPGFVDSHMHIESSILVPREYARAVVKHGVIACCCDPHEIANVKGIEGVKYIIQLADQISDLFKFYFGASPCVPATSFETAGAKLDLEEIKELLQNPRVKFLSEVMNIPAVLNRDPKMIRLINATKEVNKVVDGHGPMLRGQQSQDYFSAGIQTDHECTQVEEALEKLKFGVSVQIREGSACKDFDNLWPVLKDPLAKKQCMFCTDDQAVSDLVRGSIDVMIRKAIQKGIDIFTLLNAASRNPVRLYNLDVGLLQVNQPADFLVVRDLTNLEVLKTYVNGNLVFENGSCKIKSEQVQITNHFNTQKKTIEDFKLKFPNYKNTTIKYPVIVCQDGSIVTEKEIIDLEIDSNGEAKLIPGNDIIKIIVVNRYYEAKPAVALIKGFGFDSSSLNGAIAQSVAHDSHNIICVGNDDSLISEAINSLIAIRGGLICIFQTFDNQGEIFIHRNCIPLPICGLLSNKPVEELCEQYDQINLKTSEFTKQKLQSPFATLSFMALLVIPKIKISDMGLFDGETFSLYQFQN